jgi:Putative metal-binding motif
MVTGGGHVRHWWVIALGCAGCAGGDATQTTVFDADVDRDGWPASQDCDDLDPAIHPEAADPWYDGVDSDCGGNDDYDLDGDGHASSDHGGDDCDDFQAEVSPSAPEVPYDGTDNDCDPLSPDDDLDQDGYPLAEDCADADVSVYLGAAEVIDDGIDQDCDGNPDGSAWGFSDLTFLSPGRPHLAATGQVVALSLTATDVASPSFPPEQELTGVGVLLAFEPLATNGPEPLVPPELWYQNTLDPPGESDLVAIGDVVYPATVYFESENRFGYLLVQPLQWLGTVNGWFPLSPAYADYALVTWSSVELSLDDEDQIWMCASDDDTIAYLKAEGPASPSASVSGPDGSRGCWPNEGPGFTTCDAAGQCTAYDVPVIGEAPVASPVQPWSADVFTSIRERDGHVAATLASGGVVDIEGPSRATHFPSYLFTDAEIVEEDGALWLAGVADRGSGPELLLATIDGASTVERWLSVTDGPRTLAPSAASLLLTDERVVLAVSALDVDGTGRDLVGWMWLTR